MGSTQLAAIKDSFGRVVWTHKVHEKQVEIYSICADILDWCTILFSALTTAALLYVLMEPETRLNLSVVLSFLALIARLIQLVFNPRVKKDSHKVTAKQLWFIKEKYINLISDIIDGSIPADIIIKKRDNLTEELNTIYINALPTNSLAYKRATKALKVNDEHSFYNNEVDKFLPVGIRENVKE
jgi:hypothetical protein